MAFDFVTEYVTGELVIKVNFPKGYEGCQSCQFARYRTDQSGAIRRICSQTYESIDDLDRLHERGKVCPLIFRQEE